MKCQYKDQKRHVLEKSAQTKSTRRSKFKRPPDPLDRAEPPKHTRADDDQDSALLSVYHRDLVKMSEIL